MISVSLEVNGQPVNARVDERTLLVEFLRDHLKLTGTHQGCETSQCGACVVHLNGMSVKSCTVLTASCEGSKITTIEGITPKTGFHPMQQAFADHHGLQCGFCTPGMIMTALDIVASHRPEPLDEQTVRDELHGNLCRCTGYQNIVKAILAGRDAMLEGQQENGNV